MSWFKVDDKLWGSPKWLAMRSGPRALWVTAGSYCMDQLTDGFVPGHVIPILGGKDTDCVALVKAGLWEKDPNGYRFHDWNDYQPSRESIMDRREVEAARKAAWRAKRAGQRAASADGPEDVPPGQDGDTGVRPAGVPSVSRSSRPDPTRPDPTVPPTEVHQGGAGGGDAPADAGAGRTGSKSRGTRIPDPFPITPEMVAWAREHTPGIDHRAVTEAFVDYWRGVPGAKGVKLDWPATWRNWLRRERDDHRQPAADRPRPGASVWDKRLPEVGA